MIAMAACCLIFASCTNKAKEETPEAQPQEQNEEVMCEKQKQHMQDCEDWKNWENLTDERKAELLDMKKACYDKKKAEQAEMEALKAQFEEAMANWDKLTLDERKAAFDLLKCPKAPCGGEGGCCKGGPKEGAHPCKHDGKCPKGGEHPCGK